LSPGLIQNYETAAISLFQSLSRYKLMSSSHFLSIYEIYGYRLNNIGGDLGMLMNNMQVLKNELQRVYLLLIKIVKILI